MMEENTEKISETAAAAPDAGTAQSHENGGNGEVAGTARKKKNYLKKIRKYSEIFYSNIWDVDKNKEACGLRRGFNWLWRMIELAVAGTIKNTIPLQAAALTYYALMALAPFVMLVLTIFAFVMNVKGEDVVTVVQERMTEMMQLVLPEPKTSADVPAETVPAGSVSLENVPAEVEPLETLAPQLEAFSGMLLRNTLNNSGTGTIGLVVLLVLAVFMIARIEDAFNLVWNVKRARSWPRRFAVYFAVILLGGALFAFTMSMLSVSAVMKAVTDNTLSIALAAEGVPVAGTFAVFMTSAAPGVLAFVLMTLIFGCMNKYLPFVEVEWRPALIGGGFVSLSFILCGKLAGFFVGKISEFNSVYGNLSVIFILMFGFYLGWMFLLIGGEVAYAIQNARYYKSINRKWSELSPKTKQTMYFSCLAVIYNFSVKNNEGTTIDEISDELSVHANFIRECVETLKKQKLIVEVKTEDFAAARYLALPQAAKMTIAGMRRELDNLRDPLKVKMPEYMKEARERFEESFLTGDNTQTLQELIK